MPARFAARFPEGTGSFHEMDVGAAEGASDMTVFPLRLVIGSDFHNVVEG